MSMPVVNIRVMRVFVRHRRMPMKMVMWLFPVPFEIVPVLVMRIVDVTVGVLHRLMRMFVSMLQALQN